MLSIKLVSITENTTYIMTFIYVTFALEGSINGYIYFDPAKTSNKINISSASAVSYNTLT